MSFKFNILIVDDVKTNVTFLKLLLNENFDNVKVFTAHSASDGLEIIRTSSIDLILLDIQMPVMNGYEFARALSQNSDTRMIPIVFITAIFTSEEFINNGLDLGAIDYITKPIDSSDLVKKIKLYLKILKKQKSLEIALKMEKEAREKIHEQQYMLIQQSKLASMGEMLSMIAHQWRQPLNAMSASAIKISMQYELDELDCEDVKNHAEFVQQLTNKMSNIINDFMGFFKPEKDKETFTLEELMNYINSFLESQLKSRGIILNYSQNDVEIYSYKKEVSHILLNIIINARDAFESNNTKNPKIIISLNKGNKSDITLSIKDNAGGIPENIIDRIFEPYFTTKEQGKGTGIGLHMSKRIAEEVLGGNIIAYNEDDGAVFELTIKNQ